MRVALVIHSMGGGGAERVSAMLANAWVEQGHEVALITFSGLDADDAYVVTPGVRRIGLGLASESVGVVEAILTNLRRIAVLRRTLLNIRPDIVVGMMTGAAIAALLATRCRKIPVIVSERTHPPMLPVGRPWEILRSLSYPWANRVVMLTQDGVDWLKAAIPAARGVVIPNPVVFPLPVGEPALEVGKWVGANRKLLLAAGRMDSGKQFDLLITAFSGLNIRFPDWDLVILGAGPDRDALARQIAELELQGRVMLPGRAGNIGQWYERADLYVMSSRFEGFPNVLVEAMAHGCAAVSYDCDTGPRDIIRDGIDGLLVRPVGDVPALQAALVQLMENDAERKEMASKAREVSQRFARLKIMEMWNQLLVGSR